MNQCPNCGNINTPESQYCRACGNAIAARRQQRPDYDFQQPRPYAWKTDEFQTQTEARQPLLPANAAGADVQSYNAQPVPYAAPALFGGSYRCPNCLGQFLPRTERRISTAGWITFAVLLVFFFPLFWIGLLIKEEVHVCPSCNARIQ